MMLNIQSTTKSVAFSKGRKSVNTLEHVNTLDHSSTPLPFQGVQDSRSTQMLKYDQDSLRIQSVDSTHRALQKSRVSEYLESSNVLLFQIPEKVSTLLNMRCICQHPWCQHSWWLTVYSWKGEIWEWLFGPCVSVLARSSWFGSPFF